MDQVPETVRYLLESALDKPVQIQHASKIWGKENKKNVAETT